MSTVILNGLVMDGRPWRVTGTDLLDGVGSRSTSGERTAADGDWSTTAFRAARSGSVEGLFKGRSAIEAGMARRQLMQTAALEDFPVSFLMPDGTQTLFARRAGGVTWRWAGGHTAKWSVLLKADDPLLYLGDGSPAWTATFHRIEETGGMTVPLTVPIVISPVTSVGAADFNNQGDSGRLEFQLDGAMTAPEVMTINADGVKRLGWPSLSMSSGDFLDVDPAQKAAMLQGQASRPPVPRQWPRLTPGPNRFEFRAGPGSTGTLTVRAWPAI